MKQYLLCNLIAAVLIADNKFRENSMIVTHIFGGLGNQLFQLAIGKAVAKTLGVELRMDTRYFDKPRPDIMCLKHFTDNTPEADRVGLPAMRHDGILKFLKAKLDCAGFQVFKETSMQFDPGFKNLADNTHLQGYWQSELYFDEFESYIQDQLSVVTPPTLENKQVMLEQDKCFPVSLHVRRGDYILNAKFNAVHGSCDMDFYRRAADYIASKCDTEPTFFAFSDEPEWARENLKLDHKMRIISHNGTEHNYEDIRLMSRCRHHIVANSSFSWWGAWLNPDPAKIIVAPTHWFADPDLQNNNVVPEKWIRM